MSGLLNSIVTAILWETEVQLRMIEFPKAR